MWTNIVFATAVLVCLGVPSSRADDVDTMLAQCRNTGDHLTVSLELRQGRWEITSTSGISDPKVLATLPAVEVVELWHEDQVTAEDFRKLATLRSLRRLDLSHVHLSEKQLTYLRPLKGLAELDLDLKYPVTEAVLTELKGLANVRSLKVLGVGTAAVSALRDLPHLEHLDTGVYDDAGGKVDLSVLRGLKWLQIGNVDPGQAPLRLPKGLRRIDIETRWLRNLDLKSAPNIEQVQVDVSWHDSDADGDGRRNEDDDLKWLERLPELRQLTVTNADRGRIEEIAKLTRLHALSYRITRCPDLPTTDPFLRDNDLKALKALRELQSLTIDVTVKETGMRVLCSLPNLRHLGGVKFDRAAALRLGELKQIDGLALDFDVNREVVDTLVAAIGTMTELKSLTLGGAVTDEELAALRGLKKLRSVDLSYVRRGFTDAGLASLMRSLPDLQQVKFTAQRDPPNPGKDADPFRNSQTDGSPHIKIKSVTIPSDRTKPTEAIIELSTDGKKPLGVTRRGLLEEMLHVPAVNDDDALTATGAQRSEKTTGQFLLRDKKSDRTDEFAFNLPRE